MHNIIEFPNGKISGWAEFAVVILGLSLAYAVVSGRKVEGKAGPAAIKIG
jgi:hypothetical protein